MYALIFSGTIQQIEAATFPVCSPLLWVDVSAASPAPQVGWSATETNGAWSFAAPVTPTLTISQLANGQLAAGVAVAFATSTSLSATYATTLAAQFKIASEASWLLKNNTFVNGTTTLVLVDATGTPRSFNPTQFAAFEAAFAPYVSAVDLVADSNSGSLPAPSLSVNA